MWFKTKKINVKAKNSRLLAIKKSIPFVVWLLSIIMIVFLWFISIQKIWNFGFNFDFSLNNIIGNLKQSDSITEDKKIKYF